MLMLIAAIGAHTIWIVKFFMVVTFVLSWPISKVLDKVLGHEVGTIYTKSQVKVLPLRLGHLVLSRANS